MSRSITAARLLIVSLPFVQSLPQIIPPFQLPNVTDVSSPTGTGSVLSSTGVPGPEILVPEVPPVLDPIIDPIPIDPGIGDGPLLEDEPLPPIPLVSIPLDPTFSDPLFPVESSVSDPPVIDVSPAPESSSVSVSTFLDVVQNLLDLIKKLSPEEEPLVRPLAEKRKRQIYSPWLNGWGLGGAIPNTNAIPVNLPAVQPGVNLLTGAPTSVVAPVQALVKPIVASASSVASPAVAAATSAVASAVSSAKAAAATEALKLILDGVPAADAVKDALKIAPLKSSDITADSPADLVLKLIDIAVQLLGLPVKNVNTKRSTEDTLLPGGPYTNTKLVTLNDLYSLLNSVTEASLKFKFGNRIKKREPSDALYDFYSALASGQEPVQDLGPFTATLKTTFENLDENDQGVLLDLMNPESVHSELVKRNNYPKHKYHHNDHDDDYVDDDDDDDNSGDKNFIKYFINKFHRYAPTLFSLDPEIADGLAAILIDPTIAVPMPRDLDLDSYPDQLKQFVVEIYVFESIITDPSVSVEDKVSILQSLLDGLYIGGSPSGTPVEEPSDAAPIGDELVPEADVAPTDDLAAPEQPVDNVTPAENIAPADESAPADELVDEPVDQSTTPVDPTIIPPMVKRVMRRGLRTFKARQHYDEGTSLDDGEKLGADALNYLTNGKGTLDPLGQYDTGSYDDDRGYQADPYATDDYDYGYPHKADYDLGYKQAIEDYKKYHGSDSYHEVCKDDHPIYAAHPPKDDPYKTDPYKSDPYRSSPIPNLYPHSPVPEPEPTYEPEYTAPPKHTTPQYVQDVVKEIYGSDGSKN